VSDEGIVNRWWCGLQTLRIDRLSVELYIPVNYKELLSCKIALWISYLLLMPVLLLLLLLLFT